MPGIARIGLTDQLIGFGFRWVQAADMWWYWVDHDGNFVLDHNGEKVRTQLKPV